MSLTKEFDDIIRGVLCAADRDATEQEKRKAIDEARPDHLSSKSLAKWIAG
jgi:hypothetical protein